MVQVLLKRKYNTKVGRFPKSIDGVPTPIPRSAIDLYGLPKDAKIVGKDYRTPEQIREKEGTILPKTPAEIQAEIERKVDEMVAEREAKNRLEKGEKIAKAAEVQAEIEVAKEEAKPSYEDMLVMSVPDIVEQLPDMTAIDLGNILIEEQEGRQRKSLIIQIEAAIEDQI